MFPHIKTNLLLEKVEETKKTTTRLSKYCSPNCPRNNINCPFYSLNNGSVFFMSQSCKMLLYQVNTDLYPEI